MACAAAARQVQHFRYDIESVRIESVAMNKLRDSDVALGGQRRQQIESLKHETDFAAAEFGALSVAHVGQIVAVNQHFAA